VLLLAAIIAEIPLTQIHGYGHVVDIEKSYPDLLRRRTICLSNDVHLLFWELNKRKVVLIGWWHVLMAVTGRFLL